MKRHEAELYRRQMVDGAKDLPDEQAVKVPMLYDRWQEGKKYKIGKRLFHEGALYKVRQAHTSQAQYPPPLVPALYERIDESHAGTIDDPIPFEQGMAISNGLYYTQYDVMYLCNRDSVNPLYNDLADLVGVYVEKV